MSHGLRREDASALTDRSGSDRMRRRQCVQSKCESIGTITGFEPACFPGIR